jgi:hypothetical protein
MHLSLAHAAELTSKSGMESEEHFLLGCLSAPYLPTYLPTYLPSLTIQLQATCSDDCQSRLSPALHSALTRLALQAHKDAEERRIEALAMCRELLQVLMSTRAAASLIHGLSCFRLGVCVSDVGQRLPRALCLTCPHITAV